MTTYDRMKRAVELQRLTSQLNIGTGLRLPLDWMTLATVVYGARGAGKTVFGSVIAEEVTKHHQRFCAIDIKEDWWGLKSSADGREEGIPVVIFGGPHADLPLEEGAGAQIADLVAGLDQSTILSLEHLSKGKQIKFLTAFFERLYEVNRDPLLVLADEAQRYAPQKPMTPEATQCLGVVEDLVKLGRKHGIGLLLITQRGAGLNKEVSELCDVMAAFRTPGPLDQDRIKGWLDANATREQRDEVMGKLAGMPTGTAVVASSHPSVPLFVTSQIRMRSTFDSSATPRVGQKRAEPKRMSKPDLEKLREQMATAIQHAKDNDPKELRKQVQTLTRDLRIAFERAERIEAERAEERAHPLTQVVEKVVEVPIIDGETREAMTTLVRQAEGVSAQLLEGTSHLSKILFERWGKYPDGMADSRQPEPSSPIARPAHGAGFQVPRVKQAVERDGDHPSIPPLKLYNDTVTTTDGYKPRAGALRMLQVLAQHHPKKLTVQQMAFLAKVNRKGGTFSTYLGELKREQMLVVNGEEVTLTEAGRGMAGIVKVVTREETIAYWRDKLRAGARRMFDVLAAAYPNSVNRADLADSAGLTGNAGTFSTYLGDLRRNHLIEQHGDDIRIATAVMS